uniref:Uncharacterized protein n=1 Tax=Timema bartmani TaxID=61472 RepID=A0A7R9FAB5_9NEOP|nr:unnamed protein product [Timema bartmani]
MNSQPAAIIPRTITQIHSPGLPWQRDSGAKGGVSRHYTTRTSAAFVLGVVSLLGVTAGAHRLWAHHTYSAAWPLRMFLVICHTVVGQVSGHISSQVSGHIFSHQPLMLSRRTTADSNLVFILTKSFWPFYHYLLPWDFNSGEYGSYEDGFSTAMIKVWAALGWAFSLRTIDSEGVKKALHVAVDTGKDVKECLDEQGKIIEHIPLAKQR